MKLASQKSDLLKRQTRQWVEEFQNEGTHALTRYLASCASAYRFGDNATYCDIVAIVKPLLVRDACRENAVFFFTTDNSTRAIADRVGLKNKNHSSQTVRQKSAMNESVAKTRNPPIVIGKMKISTTLFCAR